LIGNVHRNALLEERLDNLRDRIGLCVDLAAFSKFAESVAESVGSSICDGQQKSAETLKLGIRQMGDFLSARIDKTDARVDDLVASKTPSSSD